MELNRECEVCGKWFYSKPSRIKKGWGKYCSKGCQGVGAGRQRSINYEKIRFKVACGCCGNLFNKKPSHAERCEINYCSVSCMTEDYKVRMVGKTNPNYKDGRSYDPKYHKKYDILHKDEIRCKRADKSEDAKKKMAVYRQTENGKAAKKRGMVKYIENFPERYGITAKVMSAVKSGKLTKGKCRACGSIDNIHGHHTDYSKPLEVDWLCLSCHVLWHQFLREWKLQQESGRWEIQRKSYLNTMSQ